MTFKGKRIWIIGASSGLGAAVARRLSRDGANLVLSARSEDDLKDLADEIGGAEIVPLDVTDLDAVEAAVKHLGQIDRLIYSAGAYHPMAADKWNSKQILTMIDVNLSGAIRVLGGVLPGMLERGDGWITLIGSLSGFRGLPGALGYGVSKCALMHLAENLRADLKDTGVQIQRVNPGFIKTKLSDKNDFDMPQIMEPEEAGERVVKAMRSGKFSVSFPAPFAWLFTWGRAVPLGLWQRIFA